MAVDIESLLAQIRALPRSQRLRLMAQLSEEEAERAQSPERKTLDEMAREQGVQAVRSLSEFKSGAWTEDEELEDFLTFRREEHERDRRRQLASVPQEELK